MMSANATPMSLDYHAFGDASVAFADIIAAPEDEDSDVAAMRESVAGNLGVEGLLSALTPREREVVRLRYGLDGEEPLSGAEIARRLGYANTKWGPVLVNDAVARMKALATGEPYQPVRLPKDAARRTQPRQAALQAL
jgi:hypothetical protein